MLQHHFFRRYSDFAYDFAYYHYNKIVASFATSYKFSVSTDKRNTVSNSSFDIFSNTVASRCTHFDGVARVYSLFCPIGVN